MNVSTIVMTGEQVEVLSVSGGWSTVRSIETDAVKKVRNGVLGTTTKVTGSTEQLAKAKAPKAAKEPKAPREKKPLTERQNGVVESLYLQFYQPYKTVRKDGSTVRSMDKGDSVAVQLRGMNIDAVYKHASKIVNVSVADLYSRFSHLNPGMQRMNLGNMIRKVMKEAA